MHTNFFIYIIKFDFWWKSIHLFTISPYYSNQFKYSNIRIFGENIRIFEYIRLPNIEYSYSNIWYSRKNIRISEYIRIFVQHWGIPRLGSCIYILSKPCMKNEGTPKILKRNMDQLETQLDKLTTSIEEINNDNEPRIMCQQETAATNSSSCWWSNDHLGYDLSFGN